MYRHPVEQGRSTRKLDLQPEFPGAIEQHLARPFRNPRERTTAAGESSLVIQVHSAVIREAHPFNRSPRLVWTPGEPERDEIPVVRASQTIRIDEPIKVP